MEEAETQLGEYNLFLGNLVERSNENIEEGSVIRSNPSSGSTIREEQEVDLYVSTGKQEYELDNYENDNYEEVRAELTELGFSVERVDESSETIEQGSVISQNIAPEDSVVPGETTITFTVSTGPAGFPLRDLSGYSRAGVDDYVQQNGLNVTIEEAPSETVPEGQVITQQPEAGTTLYSDSHITATFSTGPEENQLQNFSHVVTIPYAESTDENPSDSSSEQTEPNHIQIFISDAETNMDEPVHEFDMTEETQLILNFAIESESSAEYRIVRDGEVVEEETVEP